MAAPLTSTCVTNLTTLSTSMESELTQQNRNVSNTLTENSVVQFYSVSSDVTDAHLADFFSQCGPVNHIERLTSKEGKKTVFVELAADMVAYKASKKSVVKGIWMTSMSQDTVEKKITL
ncbi:hypothetical protein DAPPUDRAFT_262845 [Daphnia pulex]|uniref:RRM domain-containing protein n=1 Tax=Daphnia pulex TaxID=6669 RepID=E9HNS8_DAPPU|nr:hypothetical protein DAPPUDRAFT_262845 [Daphnia pulex]|eukprot:EFX66606.1 hypothetical protein DAPPUDRAFT_262845 [Daphnia pulex]